MKNDTIKICVVNYLHYVKDYSAEEAQEVFKNHEAMFIKVFELLGEEVVNILLYTIGEKNKEG